ncbi:hypothetical protein BN59_00122 [Legionella massiliensis]|uniref:Uncharacterized protein n=1 Tax=Legionella massiliensis TaxID=1034943 RepID=A0A078KVY3_9GAMM|nr:hypothetical protein [Legionella massiliensis]CDZ75863.1 hypothetical protein BN59_00122 [Legionella massiliensis]CEE11601.1 hypothetical protein BN1094_00122 [Legionella massiliensis]
MNIKLKHLLENIVPFLILGIGIALLIGFFIMFSYILFWGLIIGLVLWGLTFVKNLFLSGMHPKKPPEKTKGRIIEHSDKD